MTSNQFALFFKKEKLLYLSNKKLHKALYDEYFDWLNQFQLATLRTDSEKKAFWINLYNGLTNFLIVDKQIKKSMKEDNSFFKEQRFLINNITFSLDDIEHGILRKNAREHLLENDERLIFQVESLDYKIHFALNCGGQSCPILKEYSPAQIDKELEFAETSFVEGNFQVDHLQKTIWCSPIFKWYESDFLSIYLNDPAYLNYQINLSTYSWNI